MQTNSLSTLRSIKQQRQALDQQEQDAIKQAINEFAELGYTVEIRHQQAQAANASEVAPAPQMLEAQPEPVQAPAQPQASSTVSPKVFELQQALIAQDAKAKETGEPVGEDEPVIKMPNYSHLLVYNLDPSITHYDPWHPYDMKRTWHNKGQPKKWLRDAMAERGEDERFFLTPYGEKVVKRRKGCGIQPSIAPGFKAGVYLADDPDNPGVVNVMLNLLRKEGRLTKAETERILAQINAKHIKAANQSSSDPEKATG